MYRNLEDVTENKSLNYSIFFVYSFDLKLCTLSMTAVSSPSQKNILISRELSLWTSGNDLVAIASSFSNTGENARENEMEEHNSLYFDFIKYGLLLASTAGLVYVWRWKNALFSTFKDQGIPGPEPTFPWGNLWGMWREVIPEYDMAMSKKYGKLYGTFDGLAPVMYTTDPELIKHVFVKDFDHFVNRRGFNFEVKIFRKFMSFILDREWKAVRSAMTPAFSSGKIKRMSVLMTDCSQRLSKNLQEKVDNQNGDFDAKEQFGLYTLDVIGTCCFGMNIQSNGTEENKFVASVTALFSPKFTQKFIAVLPFIFPKLAPMAMKKALKMPEWRFIIDTAETLVRQRMISKISYNDFVEMSLEAVRDAAKAGHVNEEDVEEIVVAQSLLFFLAGYDTTGTTLTLTAYNLALNQEIQDKLHSEIATKIDENNGVLDHTVANGIEYLDHVINEVLRLYPPAVRTERQCNRDVQYGDLKIRKGMIVAVPMFPLHRNPESFPDPEKFDPDRWSAERKSIINPHSYMPFGAGPRNCIGMRFALEEIRLAVCTVVKEFRIQLSEKSEVPITFPHGFSGLLQPRNVYLKLESRQ